MTRSRALALFLILVLAAWLRLTALSADLRLHGDEALFATFARRAALNGDWLLPGALDKPPLALYSMALAMIPFTVHPPGLLPELSTRAGEIAARLPGMLASLLLIPLSYALAMRFYRRPGTALLAALLVAASPLAAAFGATAFTDGLMLMFGSLAMYAAARGRPAWAGAGLALAFASKQQAILVLPLVLSISWQMHGATPGRVLRLAGSFVAGVVALIFWDGLRMEPTGIFALAFANNDPARLIRAEEVLPRLRQWAELSASIFAPMSALYIPVAFAGVAWRMRYGLARATRIDILLALYIGGYMLLNWIVAFNIYDRYLLLIVLPLVLLTARGLVTLSEWLVGRLSIEELRLAGLLFIAAMAVLAYDGAEGRLDVGVTSARNRGIDRVADDLNRLTLGAILYDRWLGWELDYYLGQWTDKRRVYYPTPQMLAEGALRQPDPAPRYFIAPRWADEQPWLEAMTAAGFAPMLAWEQDDFRVYRLTPPRQS